MAFGGGPEDGPLRQPSTPGEAAAPDAVELIAGLGALLVACFFTVVMGSLVLMMLGLVVRWLSTVMGEPLPYVHDDPDRVEWGGLAELVAYGLAGALTLYWAYAIGRRVLPEAAQRHIARVTGVVALFALAVGAGWVAIDELNLHAAGIALGCGYGASRVARGLPFDDEDERPRSGSPLDPI